MKYVLVDKNDEIVSVVDLPDTAGKIGAHTYFKGVKQMPDDDEFDNEGEIDEIQRVSASVNVKVSELSS